MKMPVKKPLNQFVGARLWKKLYNKRLTNNSPSFLIVMQVGQELPN